MNPFRLVALGVGDAFSARHYSSCLALEAEETWLLLDCPHPIRKMMREASALADPPVDVDQIAAVVLSHLHSDHCSGLQALGFYMRFRCNRRLPLLAHPDVSAKLWEGVLAGGMEWSTLDADSPPVQSHLSDYFDLSPLSV